MILAYLLLTFVVVRTVLLGVVPLVQRRSWVVDARAEAVVLAGVLIVGAAIDLMRFWSAVGSGAQAPAFTLSSLVWLLVIGTVLIAVSASRGCTVIGARDDDVRIALTDG